MLYSLNSELWQATFPGLHYSLDHNHPLHHKPPDILKFQSGEKSGSTDHNNSNSNNNNNNNNEIMMGGGYMLNNPPDLQQEVQLGNSGFSGSGSLDRISFADVMQFADFGPKLALNQTRSIMSYNSEEDAGVDPICFLKFPVLSDRVDRARLFDDEDEEEVEVEEEEYNMIGEEDKEEEEETRVSENRNNNPMQLLRSVGELVDTMDQRNTRVVDAKNNKRKRARTSKTSEEVESQRMTHIAVERNRRRQMNEHLRVLRSLMPGSYVQRGDQASIIGGAIEFVRELEQLLQCLESQKRRRLYGDGGVPPPQPPPLPPPPPPQPPNFFPAAASNNNNQMIKLVEFDTGLREETAESKSCLADIEVKVLGFDAMIKILSRRRPGQLIKTIAALEDLQLNILHTNITTIEHTVLYSFNVKVASETRFTAEDIANSVQQIFSFIHANSSI